MQSSQNGGTPWNRYNNNWHDSQNGWKTPKWHDQPKEGSYAYGHNAHASSQPSNARSHAYPNGGVNAGRAPAGGGYGAGQPREEAPARPMPSFDFLRTLQGDDGSDNSDNENHTGSYHPSDQESGSGVAARVPSSDEEASSSRQLGQEATSEEREEAEQVLKIAFRDLKQRDEMRSKVSTASPSDLQAMLNARLGKKAGK